jgi:hypothetical protein
MQHQPMDVARLGWDRIAGAGMLIIGLISTIVAGNLLFEPRSRAITGLPISRNEEYLFALAVLLAGWSLPLLFRGKARRVLLVILAVETPLVVLIAWGWGRGMPS